MKHDELVKSLKTLRLNSISVNYSDIARAAESKKLTYEQFLSELVKLELLYKEEKKVSRLIKNSQLPLIKDFESYDFTCRKGVTAQQMHRLAEGKFIANGGNVVFYGSVGVGKSHLSMALINSLCGRGVKCLYTSTVNLIERLREAKANLSLASYFKKLDYYDVIACDELGYIPQNQEGAELFFQLISQRYERKSLVVTTNLPYSEWDKVFVNTITTAAAVDRILHKCETFNIEGPSWRTNPPTMTK